MPAWFPRDLAKNRWTPHLVIFVAVGAIYGLGLLDFLEHELDEARFHFLEREPSQNLVLVEIDSQSLREVSVWPWPRSYHGEVAERLIAAGAERVAFDVDFSSRSSEEEDLGLAQALARTGGKVILPAFAQPGISRDGQAGDLQTAPLPMFAEHVNLASANVVAETDGRVRRVSPIMPWGDQSLPSLFSALVGDQAQQPESFYIDYGIRSAMIPRISYTDVLLGRFDHRLVAGRDVLIGATALELGDQIPVPVPGVLPGVVVQALAYESMIGGRALQRLGPWTILLLCLLISLVLGPWFLRWSWHGGLVIAGVLMLTFPLIALGLQSSWPIILDTTPWLFTIALSYGFASIKRLKQQDLRLIAQSLAIRRKDAFMSQVVEHGFDGILTFDENGEITSFDRAAERIFGYAPASAIGKHVGRLLHSSNLGDVEVNAQELPTLRGGPYEYVAFRENGECHPVQISISEMTQKGRRLCVVLVRDMSEQRRAEAAAKEAQSLLNEAIDRINEGFALYDGRDRLVLCNRKFREMLFDAGDLGADDSSVLDGRFEDIIRRLAERGRVPLAEGRIEAWVAERLAHHRSPAAPYEEQFDDGTCVLISERPTHNGGIVAIYTDITELKQQQIDLHRAVERAETASRSKTEFLANMSHELRTPLNAIIGFSEMMSQEAVGPIGTPRYKEYASDIHASGSHLLGVINDVLDVSKIEAGKYELNEERVDLREVINSSRRLVAARAEQAGHKISVRLPRDLPLLHADERTLKQILLNLLSNAVKFTPDGGRISLTARVTAEGDLAVKVTDNGIGIRPKDLPHALALFGQVDSKLARKFEGTGLGLPLVRSLMELHGGTMQVDSEVGKGTSVTIVFPAERRILKDEPAGEKVA